MLLENEPILRACDENAHTIIRTRPSLTAKPMDSLTSEMTVDLVHTKFNLEAELLTTDMCKRKYGTLRDYRWIKTALRNLKLVKKEGQNACRSAQNGGTVQEDVTDVLVDTFSVRQNTFSSGSSGVPMRHEVSDSLGNCSRGKRCPDSEAHDISLKIRHSLIK